MSEEGLGPPWLLRERIGVIESARLNRRTVRSNAMGLPAGSARLLMRTCAMFDKRKKGSTFSTSGLD
jgi:hypothetical protein